MGAQRAFILRSSQLLAGMNKSSDKHRWLHEDLSVPFICKNSKDSGILFLFFFLNFYWSIVALQCCEWFLLSRKVNQLYVYKYPLFFAFRSHLGQHAVLSKAPCAVRQFSLAAYFTRSIVVSTSVPTSQLIPPAFYQNPLSPYLHALHQCLYLCLPNGSIWDHFSRFHVYV